MNENLTAKEAAEILNLTRASIYRYVKQGRLKAVQYVCKGKLQINKRALQTFVEKNF
jgi:excisionase family DNA binding protein